MCDTSHQVIKMWTKKSFTSILLVSVLVLELVLISDRIVPVAASKKKMMRKLKQLKDILPLLAMLKPKKKKIIILPIPMP